MFLRVDGADIRARGWLLYFHRQKQIEPRFLQTSALTADFDDGPNGTHRLARRTRGSFQLFQPIKLAHN